MAKRAISPDLHAAALWFESRVDHRAETIYKDTLIHVIKNSRKQTSENKQYPVFKKKQLCFNKIGLKIN